MERIYLRDQGSPPKDFDATLDRLAFEARHYFLVGNIGEEDAKKFHRWTVAAGQVSTDPITLHISSPGGDVFAGLSMIQSIDALKTKSISVTSLVEGQAMSMASILVQACDLRQMTGPSVMMVHGLTYFARGDIKNSRLELKLAEALTQRVIDLYVSRAKGIYADRSFWVSQLESSDPMYLMATEALDAGLIDQVI